MQFQIGFAFGHINWAEIRRDETLEVYSWWRWAFFTNGQREGEWRTGHRTGGASIGVLSGYTTVTRQILDLLLTADQLVIEVEAKTSTQQVPWPGAYTSGRAVFDLPADSGPLQAALTDCFP